MTPSGVSWTMWSHDVRYAIRLLRRSPGFAATAILTLAVSIGANAAIWSAVKGILVAPLPYPDPDRLVRLFEEAPTTPHFPFAPADFRDYRAELRTFDGIAAYGRSRPAARRRPAARAAPRDAGLAPGSSRCSAIRPRSAATSSRATRSRAPPTW